MEALQSLLIFLTKTTKLVPDEKIEAWAEDGKLIFTPTTTQDGYEVTYTANFEMADVEVNPVKLFMFVTYWMSKNIPDREQHGLPEPDFFSEPLQNGRFDLGLKIEFREQINLVEDTEGDWLLSDGKRYRPESDFGEGAIGDTLELFDSVTQDNGLTN